MEKAHKKNLAEAVSVNISDVPLEDIKLVINLIFEYLSNKLIEGKRVEIRGLGSFSLRNRSRHRNHKSNEKSSYKTVYFRGSKNFQNANNRLYNI